MWDHLEDDALQLQRDECEAISAMFTDDVTVHSDCCPISYSIKLRSKHQEVEDVSLWPRDKDLELKVEYPAKYPDDIPILSLVYSETKLRMHPIQEKTLLDQINAVAESELGTPSVLSCFYAAREFFENFGIIQAGLSILSDDCLACVLSYLAVSKSSIDCVVSALPLFAGVYKTDIVWKELCRSRWKEKWDFSRRWKKATSDFQQYCNATHDLRQKQLFWLTRYEFEECDASRRVITKDELCRYPFERRRWFIHNDALEVRSSHDILQTGLNCPGLECQFTHSGEFLSYSQHVVKYSFDSMNPNIIMLSSMGTSDRLVLTRTLNWGWQLISNDFVLRSMDEPGNKFATTEQLWIDLVSNLVMQERPPEVVSRFNWREIPDDEELQYLLPWRNSWRASVRQN